VIELRGKTGFESLARALDGGFECFRHTDGISRYGDRSDGRIEELELFTAESLKTLI